MWCEAAKIMVSTICSTTRHTLVCMAWQRLAGSSWICLLCGHEHSNQLNIVIVSSRFTFNVDTYSDTRNILTGVIDNPETLKTITTFLPKTLAWVLMRHAWEKNSQCSGDGGSSGAVKEDVLCLTARTTHTETTTVMSNSIEVPTVADDGRFTICDK